MLSSAAIAKAVSDLQEYDALKKVFRAANDEHCVVIYGNATCGKEKIARNNSHLLVGYHMRSYNFDDARDIKKFMQDVTKGLIYAEAHYSGSRRINFPVDLVEIFMQ